MDTAVRMPDIGTVESEVTLVRWLKDEGESVVLGEPLFEVETDKGVSQVEAAAEGRLLRRVAVEGAAVAAGDVIAYIRAAGPAPTAQAAAPAGPRAAARIAPALRALAARLGVDVDGLAAAAPGGLVTREDVLRAGKKHAPAASSPSRDGPALSANQATVARKVSQSHREKPLYHVSALIDMSAVISQREAARQAGAVPSYDAVFCKAVALAVTEQPLFRQYLEGEKLLEHPAADVAVAVGIGDELYVPAVRGAASMGIAEVSRVIEGLIRKTEAHSLSAKDVEGSCILVSNLGMYAIESFDAIIYPEHSAALASGLRCGPR